MFFFKKNEFDGPGEYVVVLGTSLLAMFLVSVLQQNGVDVDVLNTLGGYKQDKNKKGDYILKNGPQNQRFEFNIVNSLKKKPKYCFVASGFDEYKNDVTALSDNILKDVKIVNFASFYNYEFFEKSENLQEVRAYFAGWLTKEKKELTLLNRGAEIKICCDEDKDKELLSMLNNKRLTVKIEKHSKKLYFQTLIPWVLGNLMSLAYKKNISELLLDQNVRQTVDDIIDKELFPSEYNKENVDKKSFLPDVYAFPDGFVSEYDSLRGVLALSEMIGGGDRFSSPRLFKLIASAMKKY